MWDTVWNINRFNLKSKEMEAEDKYSALYFTWMQTFYKLK